jgi:hypothetical protein
MSEYRHFSPCLRDLAGSGSAHRQPRAPGGTRCRAPRSRVDLTDRHQAERDRALPDRLHGPPRPVTFNSPISCVAYQAQVVAHALMPLCRVGRLAASTAQRHHTTTRQHPGSSIATTSVPGRRHNHGAAHGPSRADHRCRGLPGGHRESELQIVVREVAEPWCSAPAANPSQPWLLARPGCATPPSSPRDRPSRVGLLT